LVVKLIADVSEFTSAMDKTSKKVTAVGDDLMKIGGIMTATATVPLVALGKSAVDAASDLEETKNKTMTIFGDLSGEVLTMGENAASAMGMSNQKALDFASTFGSLLGTTGMATDQITDMSMALTQLTADYASFHNLSPEEAFEKIKAGMIGSSEPLSALGKNLQQSQVQAYAAANGIGAVGQQLSQSELALARYGLLMSQSTNEVGDYVKTSDGLANSSKTAGAMLEDLSASIGSELLPTMLEFMKALIPILQGFNNMDPAGRVGGRRAADHRHRRNRQGGRNGDRLIWHGRRFGRSWYIPIFDGSTRHRGGGRRSERSGSTLDRCRGGADCSHRDFRQGRLELVYDAGSNSPGDLAKVCGLPIPKIASGHRRDLRRNQRRDRLDRAHGG
jgi:hypothetical protein